jgi:hypothetical protein
VRDYLEYIFTVMPTEEWRKDPEILDSITPCSPEIRMRFQKLIVSLLIGELKAL